MVLVLIRISALASRWDTIPVAVGALSRRSVIEPHRLAVHFGSVFMALSAGDLVMRTVEREVGLAVVERAGLPLDYVVTGGAVLFFTRAQELTAMDILVAFEALLRGV